MTPGDFRSAVIAEVQAWAAAQFPQLPVIYENGPVPDEDKIGVPWIDIELRWYGGSLATIGKPPRKRHTGAISASCYCRPGEGTAQSDQIIEALSSYLEARRLGSGVLAGAQKTVPEPNVRGWYVTGMLLPFTLG